MDPIIFKRVSIISKNNPSFRIEGNFKNVRFECIFRVTVLRDKQNDTSCNKTNKEHTVWPYKLYKCTSIKYPQNRYLKLEMFNQLSYFVCL